MVPRLADLRRVPRAGARRGGAHRPHRARSRVRLLARRAPRRRRARAEAARGAVPLPRARRARLRHRPRPARVRARRAPRRGRRARRAARPARHPRHARPRARTLLRRRGGRGGGPPRDRRRARGARCAGRHRRRSVRGRAGRARAAREAAVAIVPPGASAAFLAPLPVGLVGRPAHARRCSPGSACAPSASSPRCRPTDVRRRFGARGHSLHALAAGREQARVDRPHAAARVRAWSSTSSRRSTASTRSRSACGWRADEFIERMRAVRLVCTEPARRARRRGRRALEPQLAASAVVHARRRRRPRAVAAAGCRARPTAGLASPIVRLRVVPERIDSTGNHEEGLWGGGPDERVHHGLSRVQACSGTRRCVTAAIGGGRCSPSGRCSCRGATGRSRAHARDAPWPGSLPEPLPGDASSASRLPIALLDARGRRSSAIDERGAITAPPAVLRRRRRRGRARPGVGGSVAGRRALVGCRARPARAPVPGRRRRRLRVAARARRRGLVGRGEVRLMASDREVR